MLRWQPNINFPIDIGNWRYCKIWELVGMAYTVSLTIWGHVLDNISMNHSTLFDNIIMSHLKFILMWNFPLCMQAFKYLLVMRYKTFMQHKACLMPVLCNVQLEWEILVYLLKHLNAFFILRSCRSVVGCLICFTSSFLHLLCMDSMHVRSSWFYVE